MFRIIENELSVHLGIADKLLLKNHLETIVKLGGNDPVSLFKQSRTFLLGMGYEPKELVDLAKKQKKFEKEFAGYVLERYKGEKEN